MSAWVKSGDNWMWATWVGDTQVVYLLERDISRSPQRGQPWVVHKKVSGADRRGYVIGVQGQLDTAKYVAEEDATQPL